MMKFRLIDFMFMEDSMVPKIYEKLNVDYAFSISISPFITFSKASKNIFESFLAVLAKSRAPN